MANTRSSPFLQGYIAAEYRYQDERTEQIYSRANWIVGVVGILGTATFTAYQPTAIKAWTTGYLASAYVVSAAVLILVLIATVICVVVAARPGKYAVPGKSRKWLGFAGTQAAKASVPGAAVEFIDEELLDDLAECADANREENRRRYRWLNCASLFAAGASLAAIVNLLAAGLFRLVG